MLRGEELVGDVSMTADEAKKPTREQLAHAMGEALLAEYFDGEGERLRQPFGSVSKSQLDSAIFAGLVESGFVDVGEQPFQLAVKLKISPARVRTMIFTHMLRGATSDSIDAEKIRIDLANSNSEKLELIIDDLYTREAVLDELRRRRIFPKRDIEPARLAGDTKKLVEAFTEILEPGAVDELREKFSAMEEKDRAEALAALRKENRDLYLPEFLGAALSVGVGAFLHAVGMGG